MLKQGVVFVLEAVCIRQPCERSIVPGIQIQTALEAPLSFLEFSLLLGQMAEIEQRASVCSVDRQGELEMPPCLSVVLELVGIDVRDVEVHLLRTVNSKFQ